MRKYKEHCMFFKIKLPNGKYLAVSSGDVRDYPYEIYVGIIDEDGEWRMGNNFTISYLICP